MTSCADCTPLLLDFLYGLLDDQAAAALRDHLALCPTCQEALAQAKRQQNLFARAARKYSEVTPFQVPADEVEIGSQHQPRLAPTISAAIMPGYRARRYRQWLAFAAAAAVLLAVGGLYARYQNGLQDRQKALADARRSIDTIDDQLASLTKGFEQQRRAVADSLQPKFLQVQMVGPGTVQAGVANSYRISTQTPTGQYTPAQVTVKLVNALNPKEVVFSEQLDSKGNLHFSLPNDVALAGAEPRLVVEASNSTTKQIIEQPLAVEQPTYLTHLALSKSSCRIGETLYFRTATLERASLTPVDRPLTLDFTLCRMDGATPVAVKQLQSTTATGGIAGGDILLTDELTPGPYLLVVAEAAGAKVKTGVVRSASRLLTLEKRGEPKAIAGLKANDRELEAAKASPKVPPLALPAPPWKVEFYPEGGDLVAGSPQRVYYRIQHPELIVGTAEGVVEDNQQLAVVKVPFEGEGHLKAGDVSLGVFTFTPEFGQAYRFRLKAKGKDVDRFPLPSVLPSGVSVNIADAVLPARKPISVQVRSPVPQPLLVVASCRGRLTDQKIVQAAAGLTTVTLEPPATSSGVLRVTVYQTEANGQSENWRPAAERLVYLQPAQYLQLSWKESNELAADSKTRGNMKLGIESRNEAKELTPAWLLAHVFDETSQKAGEAQETSLPAFFLLTSQLRDPEDLEDANLLLSDVPGAAKALDLFLGTQGWRRFAPKDDGPGLLMASRDKKLASPVALFTAGTQQTDVLARFTRAVQEEQDALGREIARKRVDLDTDRERAAAIGGAAAVSLAEFTQLPMTILRHGVAIALAVLMVVGAGLLVIGLTVALRARSSPRAFLAGSTAAMVLALLLFAGTGSLRTAHDSDSSGGQPTLSWLDPPPLPAAGNRLLEELHRQPALGNAAESPSVSTKLYAAAPQFRQDEMFALLRTDGARNRSNLDGKSAMQFGALGAAKNESALGEKGALPPGGKGGFGGGGGGKGGAKKGGGAGKKDAADAGKDSAGAIPAPPLQLQQGLNQDKADQRLTQSDLANSLKEAVTNNSIVPTTTVLRQFSNFAIPIAQEQPGMILWNPLLEAKAGTADITFAVTPGSTTYRILLYGHTADGRLGVFRGPLPVRKKE